MRRLYLHVRKMDRITLGSIGVVVVAIVLLSSVHIARAQWEPPSAQAPEGNIFAPLNTSSDSQAKKGRLLLDPFYNPYGDLPQVDYPLEVRGVRNVSINDFEIPSGGSLTVDTDTLFVDGANHRVGIGTLTPDTLFEIVGGGVLVGTQASPISGTALATSSEVSYGVLGSTQADSTASVLGRSSAAGGIGVYGLHTGGGIGIRAESTSSSAVVGVSDAALDRAAPIKVAGVYGQATGLGGWAGYFQQRINTTAEVYGRKFTPTQLQNSEHAYTAGWEVREITESVRVNPQAMVFDGEWLWARVGDWNIDYDTYIFDPNTGAVAEKFNIEDASGQEPHSVNEMVMGGGDIWVTSAWDADYGLFRLDPNDPTHTAVSYETSTHVRHPQGSDGPVDAVYDDQTPGGPYMWAVSNIYESYDYVRYVVTRLTIADGTFIEFELNPDTGKQCLSFDPDQCSDGIDNDGDGNLDTGVCSDVSCTNQTDCEGAGVGQCNATWTPGDPECLGTTSPGTGTTGVYPAGDERLKIADVARPHGITIEPNSTVPTNPTIWLTYGGGTGSYPTNTFEGEGIGEFSAADPTNTATQKIHCIGPSTGPNDIAYGDGSIWISNYPHYAKYQMEGYTKFDPVAETYTFYPVSGGIGRLKSENVSSGAPYVWGLNYNSLFKFDTNGNQLHEYPLATGGHDFEFDHVTGPEDYVWSSHGTSNLISRNSIDNPYGSVTYIPVGTPSADIISDGTYIWTANVYGNTISRYRVKDGKKVGDYVAGWGPEHLVYDGAHIWVAHEPRGSDLSELTQIRATDGAVIGHYDYIAFGNNEGSDMMYDGKYIWIADDISDHIRRIDPATCTAGTCAVDIYPISNRPYKLTFDGEFVWVTHGEATTEGLNSISKVNRSDGSVVATYSIPGAYATNFNIRSITFDGTYLWVGTQYRDDAGNSVYKLRASDGQLVGTSVVYNEPGTCNGGTRDNLYCTTNNECSGGGTCSEQSGTIRALEFDGTYIWAAKSRAADSRECSDGVDNDNDGFCDYNGCGALPADLKCEDYLDTHETDSSDYFGTTTDIECADDIDNNGDGLCDFDGAAGSPGCTGKPDPYCADASDISEAAQTSFSTLSRINAGTGETVESLGYAVYCEPQALAFDGSSIWVNESGGNCDAFTLHQYYAGQGFGQIDLEQTANLQLAIPGRQQAGGFSIAGEANLGTELVVQGDIVVQENRWGGISDTIRDWGTSCPDGEFVIGVNTNTGKILCRSL